MEGSSKARAFKIGVVGAATSVSLAALALLPRAVAFVGTMLAHPSPAATSIDKRLALDVDPLIVPSADQLVITGVLPSGFDARESHLVVRDASGSVVYSRGGRLHGSQSPLDIASGFPANSLPTTLPAGSYAVVWTVDGLSSNVTHFSVGQERPDFLTAEYPEYPGGRCSDTSLIVHIYSDGDLDYCRLVTGLIVGVDRDETVAFPECSESVRGLKTSGAFSLGVPPWRLRLTPSRAHEVWVGFDGHRSRTVLVSCR